MRVLAFGTFDVVHPGHEHYLCEAKKHGDYLTVVVARDETVEKVKGRKPMHAEEERLAHVQEIGCVSEAVLGNHGDKYAIVEKSRPDVICLGYDQRGFADNLEQELKKRNIHAKIVRISSFKPERFKSSKLKKSPSRT